MKKLIELDAALDALGNIDCSDGVGISALKCDAVDDAVTTIKALPTVDAVPVVHAHWIRYENADVVDGYLIPEFECSECHSWKEDDSDYCPDCGAKMDEDKMDDEMGVSVLCRKF